MRGNYKLRKVGPMWLEDTRRYGLRGLWCWIKYWLFKICPCCGEKPCYIDTHLQTCRSCNGSRYADYAAVPCDECGGDGKCVY